MTISNLSTLSPPLDPHLYTGSPSDAVTPHARKKRGVADESKAWPQHSTVKISLSNMTQEQTSLVKKAINEWSPHTNLHFKFIKGNDGDIRIAGDNIGLGSWSALGTDALHLHRSEPTMSIDFTNPDDTARAHVLHEFGHALGLLHEHQHPECSLNIDEQAAYEHFTSQNFTKDDVGNNILGQFDASEVKTSEYDKDSIMHYPFPASLLNGGDEIVFQTKLSVGDKKFMRSMYPIDESPAGKFLYSLTQFFISRS
ncbi:M12 family metallopeptidase [Pseudomonas sp. D47]|uniref:M12 family metallopeptidase n=1 Tax=Pseudomonas sp. D47 TaxID=3159447 RepID=UPI00387AB8CA